MWKKISLGLAILLYVFALFLTIDALIFSGTMINEYGQISSGFEIGIMLTQVSIILSAGAYVLKYKNKAFFVIFVLFILINGFAVLRLCGNINAFLIDNDLYHY